MHFSFVVILAVLKIRWYKSFSPLVTKPIQYSLGHHNHDILTNRLTAVIDMSLPVITAINRNHLVTMVTGYDR